MPHEIPKAYEPQEIEARWAKAWFDENLFRAENSGTADGPKFSIALPPPNVTGSIHMGHMLEHTQIDMLVRWHRMRGERTLWLPGMDHAGIATQFVVERKLAAEGIKRQDLGREEFERRVWQWKAESGGVIKDQMIRLGASCDWTREKFTLEPELYRAVLEAFLRLYREGLIYRGRYMVNWCPRCQTAISDLEVVHNERTGQLWYIRYPLSGSASDVSNQSLAGHGSVGGRSFNSGVNAATTRGALAPETPAYLIVATTRPETMLGDTALAVHPDDDRYKHLIGKKVMLPLMNREIPIIADAYVDREFGTGVVKITPAHDPNDFEVGKRHNLPEIDVMTDDAHMSEAAGKYAGLERFVARARIVADLEELGLIEKIAEHTHSIGTCDRCKAIVEPRVSTQWFMKMKPLAEPAKKVILDGLIEVVPDNQRTILLNWLENIRDWCISRQLWWGHRIPIWHCAGCEEMIPALDARVEIVDGHARVASPPVKCPKCGGSRLPQDKDVLDTWFSSGLWPFSTLGWPDDTPDLRTYYPTSLLISGYDILFFWDARMIMMGLHLSAARFESSVGGLSSIADVACLESSSGGRSFSSGVTSATTEGASAPEGILAETIPFHRLYLHSLVRTAEGAKMSKTKGTGVDPLQLTDQYGTDAMRYMLASMSAPGTDIILSEDRILGARAFANKIWNAARFLFFNLEKIEAQGVTLEELASPEIRAKAPYLTKGESDLVHRWMFSRLSAAAREATKALEDFRFHEACHLIYQFFWGDFCDWYIEWVKPQLADANREIAFAAWRNIFAAFDAALRLLHPIMPFLTEELWHKLPQRATARSIALDKFPEPRTQWTDDDAEREMATLQEIIIAARNIRAEMKVDQKKKIAADFSSADPAIRALVQQNLDPLLRLASLSALQISSGRLDSAGAALRSTAQFDLRIAYGDTIDKAAEVARLTKERDRLSKDIASKKARLADETFLSKAPTKIVDELKATLASRQIEHEKVLNCLAQLE
ncbi:MAG TPA: valine--tRNA ligase [Candidatus Acidoferrales bacterium]|nr:valine--tRNA ligase [Candidatus Acidoferrales bacterium]